MAELMGDMMRGAAVDAVESVMDSGAMQVKGKTSNTGSQAPRCASWKADKLTR